MLESTKRILKARRDTGFYVDQYLIRAECLKGQRIPKFLRRRDSSNSIMSQGISDVTATLLILQDRQAANHIDLLGISELSLVPLHLLARRLATCT